MVHHATRFPFSLVLKYEISLRTGTAMVNQPKNPYFEKSDVDLHSVLFILVTENVYRIVYTGGVICKTDALNFAKQYC